MFCDSVSWENLNHWRGNVRSMDLRGERECVWHLVLVCCFLFLLYICHYSANICFQERDLGEYVTLSKM